MFKNYIKIAWRNILKHRFYSIVNIVGLSTGIAFTLLIAAYVWSEFEVNKSIRDNNRIFLLQERYNDGSNGNFDSYVADPLAIILRTNYPNLVTNHYRWLWKNTVVSSGDKHFRNNVQMGDTSLLSMFGFKLLFGNKNIIFKEPNSVVITKEKALQFFNTANAVGKIVSIENNKGGKQNFIVTGVLENLHFSSVTATQANDKTSASNSIFLPITASKDLYGEDNLFNWNTSIISYIKLNKNVSTNNLIKPIKQILKSHLSADEQQHVEFNLMPLSSAYLDANNGTVSKMLYTLSLTAFFILLMAVVNFVNISIGNSSSRLKEIGLRKVFGGEKKQLVIQFLSESFILVFIAVSFSLIIYQLLQPVFNNFIGKNIPSLFSFPFYFTIILIAFTIVIALLAGLYPAVILSSVKVAESVKGKLAAAGENIFLRKLLIGFQFFIAIIVFVSAIIIAQQVSFGMNKDLGFIKDQVINLRLPRNWSNAGVSKIESIKNQITAVPGVEQASVNYTVPGWNYNGASSLTMQGHESDESVETYEIISDDRYADTYQIPMLAGKFFSGSNSELDSSRIVINETLLKDLGWHNVNDAIGETIIDTYNDKKYSVAGVIKDFHIESKQKVIRPTAFFSIYQNNIYRFLSVKIKPGNTAQTINALQKRWTELMPDEPFDFTFMDETLKDVYQSEMQLKNASYIATTLALIIVLLGVIGIISLSIAKRTKEIGIRKVLGASVINILKLFVSDILLLIVLASALAIPAAYLIMKLWLNNYAYRINMQVYPFAVVFVVLILLTTMVSCFQSFQAALANPVKSLRTE